MKIAITGASGLIGSAVARRLAEAGHSITRMVRSQQAAGAQDAIFWDPATSAIDSAGLGAHDAVINLAGENIFGIWTGSKKKRIYNSRVEGTRLLVQAIAGLEVTARPAVLINASAIGYYGDRPPDQPLPEDAAPGAGFMAGVVREWEEAAASAREAGVRVVQTRFGLVLDPDGLLLQAMTLATRLGLGAKLGDGTQPFPWTTRADIAGVMSLLLDRDTIEGPVNVVAPQAVSNEELTDTLAHVLDRPRLLKVPAFALDLLGDFGRELTTGAWVVPEKLEQAGYEWRDPRLEPALRRLLER